MHGPVDDADRPGRWRACRGVVRDLNTEAITQHVSAQVPTDLVRNLEELATSNHRTRSAEIRIAIEQYVRREKERTA